MTLVPKMAGKHSCSMLGFFAYGFWMKSQDHRSYPKIQLWNYGNLFFYPFSHFRSIFIVVPPHPSLAGNWTMPSLPAHWRNATKWPCSWRCEMWLAQKRLGPTRRAEKNSHTEATKMDIYGASWFISPYGYGSIPINTIFMGMNIHKSQLFWCEQKGYKVLTHCHIWILKAKKCLGSKQPGMWSPKPWRFEHQVLTRAAARRRENHRTGKNLKKPCLMIMIFPVDYVWFFGDHVWKMFDDFSNWENHAMFDSFWFPVIWPKSYSSFGSVFDSQRNRFAISHRLCSRAYICGVYLRVNSAGYGYSTVPFANFAQISVEPTCIILPKSSFRS